MKKKLFIIFIVCIVFTVCIIVKQSVHHEQVQSLKAKNARILNTSKNNSRLMSEKEQEKFFSSPEVQSAISQGNRGIAKYNSTHKVKIIPKEEYLGYELNGKKLYHKGLNNKIGINQRFFHTEEDAQDAGYVLDTN